MVSRLEDLPSRVAGQLMGMYDFDAIVSLLNAEIVLLRQEVADRYEQRMLEAEEEGAG